MVYRAVTRSRKDSEGDITALGNPGQFWSPRSKAAVISDIESGGYYYYVPWNDGMNTEIRVVNGATGKYLRTDHDNTERNNLDDLQDC